MFKFAKTILPFLIISFLVGSCKKCPPGKIIGEAQLSKYTTNFLPYSQVKTVLEFKNADNKSLFLTCELGKVISKYELVVDCPCSNESSFSTTYNSMLLEWQAVNFNNDSIVLELMALISNLDDNTKFTIDTNWVETVHCRFENFSNHSIFAAFSIITNTRGKEISQKDIEDKTQYLFSDSLSILNKTFYQVYSDKFGQNIFFTKEKGVIGFRYNSKLYVLVSKK